MMADYYTLESIRDELLKLGTVDHTSVMGTFPIDWKYCPCIIIKKCTMLNNKVCLTPIMVGISTRIRNIGLPIVEIIYERATREGFIRAENLKINQLIQSGVIDKDKLKRVTKLFN